MKKRTLFYKIPMWILLAVGILLVNSANWFFSEWGEIDFAVVLYQLSSPLKGTDPGIIQHYIKTAAAAAVCEILLVIGLDLLVNKGMTRLKIEFSGRLFRKRFRFVIGEKKGKRFIGVLYIVLGFGIVSLLIYDVIKMGIPEYIDKITHPSTIFEEEYVNPNVVDITFPEEKKNVVWIYLESMEASYASQNAGGAREVNLIPNLTKLADENISFRSSGQEGGLNVATGGSWTMGALLSTSSGVPYLLPIEHNGSEYFQQFLPGLTTMGDVLAEEGYNNYFMCGSDIEFGGRYQYYNQHGNYEIYDFARAKQDGIIAQDYEVFWGMEDARLYPWAQSVLTEIAAKGEPFNFTMLTVDSHYPEGYICEICDDTYEEQYANAIACSDRQIQNFIEWIQQQEWYEDTVVVITGDHLTMSKTFLEDIPEGYVRQTYNCFINPHTAYTDASRLVNRTAYTMDMFPTVLSAMGVKIEGERLGLGTNLFSSVNTLAEEMGKEEFEDEVSKYSYYYEENFIQDK